MQEARLAHEGTRLAHKDIVMQFRRLAHEDLMKLRLAHEGLS